MYGSTAGWSPMSLTIVTFLILILVGFAMGVVWLYRLHAENRREIHIERRKRRRLSELAFRTHVLLVNGDGAAAERATKTKDGLTLGHFNGDDEDPVPQDPPRWI